MEKHRKEIPKDEVTLILVSDSIGISYGNFSSMCYGYCSREISLVSGKITAIKKRGTLFNETEEDYPTIKRIDTIPKKEWEQLVAKINFDVFCDLPEKVGCPGCDDSPIEWLEIYCNGKKKQVWIESGTKIEGLNELLFFLRGTKI